MSMAARYFFIVQTPSQRCDDEAGVWLPDDQCALAHAEALIQDLKSDGKYDFRDWLMLVQDAGGRTVYSMPV
jgi:hypothetical protein